MRMIGAVDVGYGWVKAVADTGSVTHFPAVFAPDPAEAAWDQALGGARSPDRVQWTQPGARGPQTYWVGEAARRLPGAQRPWHSDAAQRAGYTLLVDAACAALAPPGGGPCEVDLVVGLPLALFASQKAAIHELLHGHVATVRRGAGEPVTLAVTTVTVLPQAAGAYYAATLGPGADPAWTQEPVAVVDVGTRTTDYFVMQPDSQGQPRPVRALSGSLDCGLHTVTEAVRQALGRALGHLLDPLRVEAGLTADPPRLRVSGTVHDLAPLRAEAAADAARRIADQLRSVWGPALDDFAVILLAGGGAAWLGPTLQAAWPQARSLPDPALANARGFLAARQLMLGVTPGVRHG